MPRGSAVALRAGLLCARHYRRRSRAISQADCSLPNPQEALDDSLATADPHLLDTCRDEGINVDLPPDSNGATWSS